MLGRVKLPASLLPAIVAARPLRSIQAVTRLASPITMIPNSPSLPPLPLLKPIDRTYVNLSGTHQGSLEIFLKQLDELNRKDTGPSLDKAKYQSVIATVYRDNGQLENSLSRFTSSLEMYQKLEVNESVNPKTIKELLISIASVCQGLDRYKDAAGYLEQAIDWSTEQNCATPAEMYELNARMASIAEACQDYERALKAYQSINETIHLHNSSRAAKNAQKIGHCHLCLRDYETAAEYFKISLELYQEDSQAADRQEEIVYSLLLLSRALIGLGDYSGSLEHLAQVGEMRRNRLDLDWNPAMDGVLFEAIAESHMWLGKPKMALDYFNSALESLPESDVESRSRIYYLMGETCVAFDRDRPSAIQFYSKSIQIQSHGGPLFVDTNMSLARLYILQDELTDSLRHLTAVLQHLIQEPSDSLSLQLELSASMSYCHIQLGSLSSAKLYSDCAVQFLQEMDNNSNNSQREYETMSTVESLLRLAEAWKTAGRSHESLAVYRLLSTKLSGFLDNENQKILVKIHLATAELYQTLGDTSNHAKFSDLATLSAELLQKPTSTPKT